MQDEDFRFINPIALQNHNQKKQKDQDEFIAQILDRLHRINEHQLIQFNTEMKNILYPEMKKLSEHVHLLEMAINRENALALHGSHKIAVAATVNMSAILSVIGMLFYLIYHLR